MEGAYLEVFPQMAHPSALGEGGVSVSVTPMHEDTEPPLLLLLGRTGLVAEVSVTGKLQQLQYVFIPCLGVLTQFFILLFRSKYRLTNFTLFVFARYPSYRRYSPRRYRSPPRGRTPLRSVICKIYLHCLFFHRNLHSFRTSFL